MDLPIETMQESAARATRLLKSMANESRLLILCRLCEQEMSVGELVAAIPLSQSALSQHLSVLRREGLVKTRRDAQFVYYSLDSAEVQAIIATLYDLFCREVMEGLEQDTPPTA